jgi:hypothetical protein
VGIEATELVVGPPGEGVVHNRINAEQDRFAIALHE